MNLTLMSKLSFVNVDLTRIRILVKLKVIKNHVLTEEKGENEKKEKKKGKPYPFEDPVNRIPVRF